MSISCAKPSDLHRYRLEVADDLRRALPKLEGLSPRTIPFGIPGLDSSLPYSGLAIGALHEMTPAKGEDLAAAFGFISALLARMSGNGPIVIAISPRGLGGFGRPHGHGLNALGLDPNHVIFIEPASERETLWALEETLRSGVPTAVAGAIGREINLKSSQRLQIAARTSGVPLLLLRPAATISGSAATTRWRIAAAKAARDRFGLVTRWRWHVQLERCRNGRPGQWMLEWDHVTHRFCLASALADPALPCSASPQSLARTG